MRTQTKVLLGILVGVIIFTGWLEYQNNQPNCVVVTPDGEVVRSCEAEGTVINVREKAD